MFPSFYLKNTFTCLFTAKVVNGLLWERKCLVETHRHRKFETDTLENKSLINSISYSRLSLKKTPRVFARRTVSEISFRVEMS